MKHFLGNLNYGPIGSRILSLFLTLLLSVIITRTLAPDAAGVFFYAITLFYLFSTVGRLGLDNYILKLGRTKKENLILIDSSKITLLTTLLVTAICLIIIIRFNPGFDGIDKSMLILGSVSLIPYTALVVIGAYIRTLGKISGGIILELALPPLITIGIYSLFSFFWEPTLYLAFASFLLGIWISSAAALIILKVLVQQFSIFSFAILFRKPDFSNVPTSALLLTMFSSVMLYSLTWAPVLVIGYVNVSPSEVTYLFIAMRISALVSIIPTLQTSGFGPAIGKAIRDNDISVVNLICKVNVDRAVIFSLVTAIGICSSSWLAIPIIFGTNLQPAVLPTIILTLGNLFVVFFGQVVIISQLLNRLIFLNFTLLIVIGSWLIIGPTVSLMFGADGIAWEMFCTSLILSITLSVYLWRKDKVISFFDVTSRFGQKT